MFLGITMKFTALGLALAASALAASPAMAQDTALDRTAVIDTIDDATLKAAVAAIGGTTSPLDDEENTLRIAYPNGMRGVARRMACTGKDACKGLILLGYFTPPLPPGQGPEVVPPDFLFNGKVASWGDEMYEQVSARAQEGAV